MAIKKDSKEEKNEEKVHASEHAKEHEKHAEKAPEKKEHEHAKEVKPEKTEHEKPAEKAQEKKEHEKHAEKAPEKKEKKEVHAAKPEKKKPEEAKKEAHESKKEAAEHKPETKEAPKVGKKKAQKKKSLVVLARGKRKEAVARAVISPGKGRYTFNRILFGTIPNRYIREIVMEPLGFIGKEAASMDINVSVHGGGQLGQAQAARTAIAKALVEYLATADDKLKATYLEHDRSLLVDDVRRVEPKKYKGPKARARFQKSYR